LDEQGGDYPMEMFFIERPRLITIQEENLDNRGIITNLSKHLDVYVFCFSHENQLQIMINHSLTTLNEGQVLFGQACQNTLKIFGTGTKYYILQIACAELKHLLKNSITIDSTNNMFTVIDLAEESSLLKSMCEQLLREIKMKRESEMVTSSILECIVLMLARALQTNSRDEESFVKRTQKYIREHYREDLSLSDLASHVNVSVYYLSHIFKEKTGISPMKYAINCRMEQAKKLLINSADSISAIALEVGYDNSNYFSMLFKKTVGQSPLQYRRKHKKI